MGGDTYGFGGVNRIRTVNVSQEEADFASDSLADDLPLLCCRHYPQASSFVSVLGVCAGWLGLLAPDLFIFVLTNILLSGFLILIAFRAFLSLIGAFARRTSKASEKDKSPPDVLSAAGAQTLPHYSILVPLYQEAASVPGLVAALEALDYPTDRLDVLFLTENDDTATRQALLAQLAASRSLQTRAQILTLPDGMPRTKPRALNVALHRLAGGLVTIYDAEDRPHPDQLKRAAAAMQAGGENLACVQAPLYAYNAEESWLAGQWALEYDVHFGLILPALAKFGLPVALGGTSNHFRVSALRRAGGWDAWNVTEDADIGLRFARMGERVGVISPPTQEEGPETLRIWVRQRSRWIKGYIQTWLVLMRQPVLAARQMGVLNFVSGLGLLSGAIGSALLHAPCLVWLLLCLLSPEVGLAPIGQIVLIAGYAVSAGAAGLAPNRTGANRWKLIASFWLYWPLLSWAAAIALYEMLRAPHTWAKTPHALTRQTPQSVQEAFA